VSRVVHCEDAVGWLESSPILTGCSLIGSLPDISEFPSYTINQWNDWFIRAASLIISKTPDDGVAVFYQSDIKLKGVWIEKGYLCQKAAESSGHHLLWHKIACRAQPGHTTFGRPGYSHILCFSKNLRVDLRKSSADVIPDIGDKIWARGMGINACLMIAKFIAEQTSSTTIVNPFCGHGSMLAAANVFNLSAVGIERSPKRSEIARELKINLEKKCWEPNNMLVLGA